ncbi:MAG: hypothetical protein Tsb009_36600 [Planctomycetaceae bacterium]
MSHYSTFSTHTIDLPTRVRSHLERSPHFLGRRLNVELKGDDEVILTGFVETYYQKQLAQESLREIEGLGRIHNELEVRAFPPRL